MARVEPSTRELVTEDAFVAQAKEYIFLKKEIDALESKAKQLRDLIISEVDSLGEADSDGHILLDLDNEIDGVVSFKKERRVSRKIDEDKAAEIIDEKGLEEQLYKTVRVVDEDALMVALYSDLLTDRRAHV